VYTYPLIHTVVYVHSNVHIRLDIIYTDFIPCVFSMK
jgi:hypothetical protein